MTELPIQALLLEAIAVLDGLKVPYMVMGGFAVRAWAIPRPTYDADLAIDVDDDGLARLLDTLQEAGFEVPGEYAGGFRDKVAGIEKVKVTRVAGESVWEVDLFLARGEFFRSALRRRRPQQLAGHPVQIMAPEDVILLKLIAHRRKDQLDIEEILKVMGDLDLGYLRSWAQRLDVAQRLEVFLAEDG